MITDRDICIAVGTRHRPAGEIAVADVMSQDVATCGPTDDVQDAAAIMRLRRVRRLPVVNNEGLVVGLLTLDDIARKAGSAQGVAVSPHEVVALMRAIRGGVDRDEGNIH
jgi:CBS domain-containing protein